MEYINKDASKKKKIRNQLNLHNQEGYKGEKLLYGKQSSGSPCIKENRVSSQ